MLDNSTEIIVDGQMVRTLKDILPDKSGLKILFVAKTPTPQSVAMGHYFQGRQGTAFWNRLIKYGLLEPSITHMDDSLLAHGYGLTDIVKVPRPYGNEPSIDEYEAGIERILNLVRDHNPEIVVFVYKGVLDNILKIRKLSRWKSDYGFNPDLDVHFGCRVFVFPMSATRCTRDQARVAMLELADSL